MDDLIRVNTIDVWYGLGNLSATEGSFSQQLLVRKKIKHNIGNPPFISLHSVIVQSLGGTEKMKI